MPVMLPGWQLSVDIGLNWSFCQFFVIVFKSSAYIVPVLMYGCETWATTKYLLSRLDAFDTWALRKILRIPYNRRLPLFGHIACTSPREDHHRALAACIRQVPPDWKRPAGRSSHTWLRAIEADLGPLNFGLATAWRKATTETNGDILSDNHKSCGFTAVSCN